MLTNDDSQASPRRAPPNPNENATESLAQSDENSNRVENSQRVVFVPVVTVPVVVAVPVPIPVPAPPGKIFGDGKNFPGREGDFPGAIGANEAPSRRGGNENPSGPSGAISLAEPSDGGGRAISLLWRKFGGTGFVISAIFHFALFTLALFLVFSNPISREPEQTEFVSGSGGQSAGIARSQTERAFRRPPEEFARKITSRAKTAKIAIPELPKLAPMQCASRVSLSKFSGNASGGNGDGSVGGNGFGGGLGNGVGVGIGDGKNFLGKFKTKMLLGAKIQAEKIAVYLDCSGSMKHRLPAVKEEIYKNFPDADVFAYSGAGTEVLDGAVVGGRAMRAKTLAALKRKRADDETETGKLSGAGRVIYKRYAAHFAAGTAGAWLDIMSHERYDALVIFSDFRDGIRQRRDGKTIYADSTYSPTDDDARTSQERRWETEWLSAFSRGGAPKLYLFSTKSRPQELLEKCAEKSGGSVTILNFKKSTPKKSSRSGRGNAGGADGNGADGNDADGNGGNETFDGDDGDGNDSAAN